MKLVELVDRETGEIEEYLRARDVYEIQAAQERQRAAYKVMKERAERKAQFKAVDNRGFIKAMSAGIDELNKELTLIDAGLLFRLSVNMRTETGGMLIAKINEGGKPQPLKKSDLQKVLKKSKEGIKKAIDRLLSIGVIRKEKQGRNVVFFVNESVVSIGKSVGPAQPFTKIYKTQAKELLENLTDSEAGLILKMTAYVNYHYLVLTHNPSEKDADKAQPLRLHELSEKLGVEEKYCTVLISNLKRKGAVATFDTGTKGKSVLIHPYLCDRGNDGDTVSKLVTQFFKLMR